MSDQRPRKTGMSAVVIILITLGSMVALAILVLAVCAK
jgi:hypothetical protein